MFLATEHSNQRLEVQAARIHDRRELRKRLLEMILKHEAERKVQVR